MLVRNTQGLRCPPTQQGQRDLPIVVADERTAGNDYRNTACSQWAQHLDSATAAVYAEGRIILHSTRQSESKYPGKRSAVADITTCRHVSP